MAPDGQMDTAVQLGVQSAQHMRPSIGGILIDMNFVKSYTGNCYYHEMHAEMFYFFLLKIICGRKR